MANDDKYTRGSRGGRARQPTPLQYALAGAGATGALGLSYRVGYNSGRRRGRAEAGQRQGTTVSTVDTGVHVGQWGIHFATRHVQLPPGKASRVRWIKITTPNIPEPNGGTPTMGQKGGEAGGGVSRVQAAANAIQAMRDLIGTRGKIGRALDTATSPAEQPRALRVRRARR